MALNDRPVHVPAVPLRLFVDAAPLPRDKPVTLGQYLRQLSRHRNFLWFVSMNLVQVCYHGDTIKVVLSHMFQPQMTL